MKIETILTKIYQLQNLVKEYTPLIAEDNDFYSIQASNLREDIQDLYYEIEPYIAEAIGNPIVEIYQQRMPAFEASFSEMNPTASFYAIKSVPQLLRKASAYYKRKPEEEEVTDVKKTMSGEGGLYVKEEIISLIQKKDDGFDYSKLEFLVNELNKSYLNHDVYSSLSLIRTIQNHIPPLFGFGTFEEVVNNHSWGRTDKKYMQTLNQSRDTSNGTLHRTISNKKDLSDMGDMPPKICINTLLQEALVNGISFEEYLKIKKDKVKKIDSAKQSKPKKDVNKPIIFASLGSSSRGGGSYLQRISIKNYGKEVGFLKSVKLGDVIIKKSNLALDEKETAEFTFKLHGSELRQNKIKKPKLIVEYVDLSGNLYSTIYDIGTQIGDNKLLIVRSLGEPQSS